MDVMCYVHVPFLPGMIRMLLTSDFDEKSAMQYRILSKLAGVECSKISLWWEQVSSKNISEDIYNY